MYLLPPPGVQFTGAALDFTQVTTLPLPYPNILGAVSQAPSAKPDVCQLAGRVSLSRYFQFVPNVKKVVAGLSMSIFTPALPLLVSVPPGGNSVVTPPADVTMLLATYTIFPRTDGLLYRGVILLNTWADAADPANSSNIRIWILLFIGKGL